MRCGELLRALRWRLRVVGVATRSKTVSVQYMKIALTATVILASALLGCGPSKPDVICIMQNPSTGARVEMYKEIPSKVPANYDEKKHIEQWKAEQIAKGYSVDITKR